MEPLFLERYSEGLSINQQTSVRFSYLDSSPLKIETNPQV